METKKFLDSTGVSTLWSKIKEEDAKLNAAIVAEDTARKEADNAAAARISANETNIAANSTAIAKKRI